MYSITVIYIRVSNTQPPNESRTTAFATALPNGTQTIISTRISIISVVSNVSA